MNGTLTYNFTAFEILRDYFLLSYVMSTLSLRIESTNSTINKC